MTDRTDDAIRAQRDEGIARIYADWLIDNGDAADEANGQIIKRILARAVAAEAREAQLQREVTDLRKRLGAATCPVAWPSGTHSPPHQCSESEHHLTRHRCACGVKG